MIEDDGEQDRGQLLQKYARALRKAKVPASLTALPHARVPIVKWTDKATGVQVDACFGNVDGLHNTALLARAAAAMPALRPLVLVLKSQLRMHGLHETHTGGVGGYLLANMVRHLLLTPPPPPPSPPTARRPPARGALPGYDDECVEPGPSAEAEDVAEDLGGLLLRFYWYYGHRLDLGTSIVFDGAEGLETSHTAARGKPGWVAHAGGALSLIDPAKVGSDVGAKAYRFGTMRQLLRTSYSRLCSRLDERGAARDVAPFHPSGRKRKDRGLLGAVLPKWGAQHGRDRASARVAQQRWLRRSKWRGVEERHATDSRDELARLEVAQGQLDPVWAGAALDDAPDAAPRTVEF